MPHPFTPLELKQLLDFIGYGTLDADVWFLGMEEAGGGEDNLRQRLKFERVEDCAKAHDILGIRKHHWDKKIIQSTWRNMCRIMLGLEGKEVTRENTRNYQAESLGRSGGRTLLIELMPIPKPKLTHWEYEELFPKFSSIEKYYEEVKPTRVQLLKELIQEHSPRVVIGYGKKYWPDYKSLFDGIPFTSVDQFQLGKDQNTLILLTDHFTYKSMNNKSEEIVKLIKQHSPAIK
jgi:hypothetical protein